MKLSANLPAVRPAANRVLRAGALLAALSLAACATGPNANPADPLEPFNRGVTRVNDVIDDAVMRPVAIAYEKVVPLTVRTGVGNFFNNLVDVWSFANSVMQLRAQQSAQTFMRVNVNTFFGLGGILDVASEIGIERHREDFGQTLGRWGVPSGPYLVLPLLGPSTVRDAAALPVDYQGGLISNVDNIPVRNSLYGMRLIDARTDLLKVDRMLSQMALDKYSFTRDIFLQRRLNDVYDGNPPDQSK
ncbi:VacJ family lipoprotein [Variovorax sp. J22R133]|uniref:MlaA family lipoprotein n=1 Tax=Variovorax brevis TaxID=3053503 RepID=UPI0025780F63|nr:VacJ family lipoprotein [Variovorax sp. J22R133]MDM0114428.1 VacJ family lipoprotein [Variovorax sp. J22R133]